MFVLDCSVTMAWAFHDESAPATLATLERAGGDGALTPAIWPLEVCNAVANALRRERFTPDDVALFLDLVAALPVTVEDLTREQAFDGVLPLALQHDLSSHDAAYLELALRRRVPLATLDTDLARAARAAGVEVLGA